MSKAEGVEKKRIHFMDEVRGLDILLMVIFHAAYVAGWIFHWEWGRQFFLFFKPVEALFSGIFIFICGVSCRLSHGNLKRGLLIGACALLISLTLYFVMPEQMIWFGILHFLSAAVLLFALLRPLLDRIPVLPGLIACILLMLLTWHLPPEDGGYFGIKGLWEWRLPYWITSQRWLYPLGLGTGRGVDYFPLFPWFFCLLAGSYVGRWAQEERLPDWMYVRRVPFFIWAGRHTLIIYLLHQPVAFLLFAFFSALI